MLAGKVNAAMRMLDHASTTGILQLSEETMRDLKVKHPEAMQANEEVLMTGEISFIDPVMFSAIDESTITKAALHTKGVAGPSGLDANDWRRILVSKNFGNTGTGQMSRSETYWQWRSDQTHNWKVGNLCDQARYSDECWITTACSWFTIRMRGNSSCNARDFSRRSDRCRTACRCVQSF